MNEVEVKQLFIETGAILEGHFLYTSGLHGSVYIEKFQVLQYPEHTARLCAALAEKVRHEQIDLVVGPVTGGVLLAHEVGKNLGTRAIFTEREQGKMTLRRGFVIKPGERVLVVEDIVTTGGSVQEVLDVVREHGGNPVAVAMLVDRSRGQANFGIPAHALLTLSLDNYHPDNCPMCQAGQPFTKRGSRSL